MDADAATGQRECASHQIEYDVENGPSFGGLSLIVPIHSWTVLNETYHQLAIAQGTDRVPILGPF